MPGGHVQQQGPSRSLLYIVALGLVAGFMVVGLVTVSVLNGQGDADNAGAAEATSHKLAPYWTVKAGQSYSSIAEKTGLSIEDLETFNPKTDPSAIVPGQRLKLRLHMPKPKPKPLGPRWWTVRTGQSFGSIAARTGRSIDALRRLNPKVKAAELQPGDRIRLRR